MSTGDVKSSKLEAQQENGGSGNSRVEQLLVVPLHVNSLKIEGNENTASDYIEREFKYAELWQAKTMREVAQRASQAQNELRAMGIFESVQVTLDAGPPAQTLGSAGGSGSGSGGSRLQPTTDVKVNVKERRRFGAKAELLTEVQSGERSLKLGTVYRNAFGRGEILEGSVSSADNFLTRGFDFSITKPKFLGSRNRFRVGVFDQSRDSSRWSSYRLKNRGLSVMLSDPSGRHDFGYEASFREVYPSVGVSDVSIASEYLAAPSLLNVSQPAAAAVLAHARPSMKSALKYTYTLDYRDSKAAPTTGKYLSLTSEFAGLGGDVDFVKAECDVQNHFPITNTLSFGLTGMIGAIRPFSLLRRGLERGAGAGPAIPIVDRFFLGGPLALRGYGPYAVGPRDSHDALGGDTYAAAGMSLSWLLPFKVTSDYGVRTQTFVTAGNLINYDNQSSIIENLKSLKSGTKLSAGVGLVVPTPIGRFELNLAQPLSVGDGERTQRFQIGLGYRFL